MVQGATIFYIVAGEQEIKSGASGNRWIIEHQHDVAIPHHVEGLSTFTSLPIPLCRLIALYASSQTWHYDKSIHNSETLIDIRNSFMYENKRVMLGYDFYNICFFDIDSGKVSSKRMCHNEVDAVEVMAYLPKKQKILVGKGTREWEKYQILLYDVLHNDSWNIDSLKLHCNEAVRRSTDHITYIEPSPDRDTFATCSRAGMVCLWNIYSEAPLYKCNYQKAGRMSWSSDGRFLFIQQASGVSILDIASELVKNVTVPKIARFKVFPADNDCIVLAKQDRLILYNYVTEEEASDLNIIEDCENTALCVSPQGQFAAAVYMKKSDKKYHLYVWEPQMYGRASRFVSSNKIGRIAFGSEDTLAVIMHLDEGTSLEIFSLK